MQKIIEIINGITRHPNYRLSTPVNFTLERGEHLAVYGKNGSGKSLFIDILTGAHPLLGESLTYNFSKCMSHCNKENIRYITFRDVYGNQEPSYYQQRWNQADEAIFPTVRDVLMSLSNPNIKFADMADNEILAQTGLLEHLYKPINRLSSGELRRLQLAKTLLGNPQLLIIDNPYIGLDVTARENLTNILSNLSKRLTIIVVVSRCEDIAPFIRQVLTIKNKKVCEKLPRKNFLAKRENEVSVLIASFTLPASETSPNYSSDTIIDFQDINIRYGKRTILKDFNWQVKRGEHWALTGQNGAGKSTLLSLICADNPMAYACNITLFGKRRGQGESIWDIKKHIGYVSPEIFTAYKKSLPAIDIVCSGLRDTIGLYKQSTPQEREKCNGWLKVFGIEDLSERNYLTLSSGEPRLLLLVRAFVKNPQLLILDEPFHGLDDYYRKLAKDIIDQYMKDTSKTLIMVSHYAEEFPTCINRHLHLEKQADGFELSVAH